MVLPSKNNRFLGVAANVCRLLLALVFLLSGFLKAADPVGAAVKLQEYAELFSFDTLSGGVMLFGAMLLASFEFLLGVFLFTGAFRRLVSFLSVVVMLVFVPLSFYVWFNGSMDDCGCFGNSIAVSPRDTFFKNVVLLLLAVIVYAGRARFVPKVSSRCRWMVTFFSLAYIITLNGFSYFHLPVVDFGHFAVGKDVRELTTPVPGRYELQSVYVKDSVEIVLPCDSVPGDGWDFVETRSLLVEPGVPAVIAEFSIIDWDYDREHSDEILSDTGYVCLVSIERVERASVARVDKINDLYDHCVANGVPFYAVSASSEDDIRLWGKRTGAEYPVYWADAALLRSMVRSNPGLLLFKDGVVVGKWNVADIPDMELLELSSTGMPDGVRASLAKMQMWQPWAALFGLVLFFILLLDVVLSGIARRRLVRAAEAEKLAGGNRPAINENEL